ncbi:hypothetical protein F0223_21455 [Vibrio coralliilyticus]|uniref:hypothetical protein n=1 Tax=Vibrio coralliilyticus TaxID=190893 RepID=UPI00148BE691|nr:hypothetical protein [Vibrio coralliilyticus]NOI20794.1 hypothetical protein [Vibrio coralliilyticus]
MSKKLYRELDIYFESEFDSEDLKAAISEAIVENESEFGEVTGGHCSQTDVRARYLPDSLEVEYIEFTTSIYDEEDCIASDISGYAQVSFEYAAYYGCKDLDGGDSLDDCWNFRLLDGKLIFNIDIPEQRYDEL